MTSAEAHPAHVHAAQGRPPDCARDRTFDDVEAHKDRLAEQAQRGPLGRPGRGG